MKQIKEPSSRLLATQICKKYGVPVFIALMRAVYVTRRAFEIRQDKRWLRSVRLAGPISTERKLALMEWNSGQAEQYLLRWFGPDKPEFAHGDGDPIHQTFEKIRPLTKRRGSFDERGRRRIRASRRYESAQQITWQFKRRLARQVTELMKVGGLNLGVLIQRSGVPMQQIYA